MKNLVKKRGFTLIELLVVVAIIGLLSSVVFASLNTARAKARDAKRKSDLKQIQIALELHYDKTGNYQLVGGGANGNGNGWVGFENSSSYQVAGTRVLFNEGFLGAPRVDDPIQNPGYMIYYCNNYQEYALSATLENPSAADIAFIQTTCNGTGSNGTYTRYGKNYAVRN